MLAIAPLIQTVSPHTLHLYSLVNKMKLIDYSDSDVSETDTAPPSTTSKPPAKPAFEKVVDRSNPHKIRVQLPKASEDAKTDDATLEESRPSKKPRVGGGAFSGFNSFLPAPKRTAKVTGGSAHAGDKGLKRGTLGNNVNLKTGAAPAFSREVEPSASGFEELPPFAELGAETAVTEELGKTTQPVEVSVDQTGLSLIETAKSDIKKDKKPMMFKPLSIARNTQKTKKALTTSTSNVINPASTDKEDSVLGRAPKKSLFSIGSLESSTPTAPSNGDYTPVIYEPPLNTQDDSGPSVPDTEPQAFQPLTNSGQAHLSTAKSPESLTTIASDLHLSETAKRQLFGRQQKDNSRATTINVINFNTDKEYAANEILRATAGGESKNNVNPVRAIAPGKHNLKQLVSAVSTQKDALEEQFAQGRRNKKEAGSRYGW